jgi:LmeA-like phospholipid-binding
MELITILLSGTLGLFSFVGIAVDRNVEASIRNRFDRVDDLQVRVDNAPAHQILGGRVNKIRVAGKGVWVDRDIRVETLQLESDPLELDLQSLREDGGEGGQIPKTTRPIQGGIKLGFTERDLNNALKSETFKKRLERMSGAGVGSLGQDFKVSNPQIKFLANNRIGIKVDLQDSKGEGLKVDLQATLQVNRGQKVDFLNPTASVNGTPVPEFILAGLTEGLSEQFSVASLAPSGITARILKLEVKPQKLEIALFARIEPNRQQ